jgi:glutathione S-transferase
VPTIVDGDFVLYESNAIVEYLDEAYPGRGLALFPGDARRRATVRRIVSEVDSYTTEAVDHVVERLLGVKPEERDAAKIDEARRAMADEFALLARYLAGDFLAGPLSAADFALYPALGFMDRCHQREPTFDASSLWPPALAAWKKRVEALPYLDWRA